jgi:hypothetical protein
VFPVRYKLNLYILYRKNLVFKGLRTSFSDLFGSNQFLKI